MRYQAALCPDLYDGIQDFRKFKRNSIYLLKK
jgi:hypothetical protein